jgi:DNA-binding NtrC family response regulator
MENKQILLVDDETLILKTLSRELKANNFKVQTAESGEEAVNKLSSEVFDLVLTDLQMIGMGGIEVLKQAKQLHPHIPVVILTGHSDLNSAIDAVRYGADDYLLKPCDIDELVFRISTCLDKAATQSDAAGGVDGARPGKNSANSTTIIGRHSSMVELNKLIQEAAEVDLPVLILGESGTGKELVARSIHDASPRKDRPFVVVNCAALPHELVESELFGHVKGSFTGAIRDKKGRFELADGGSIFLDEIGELAPDVQVKLLRVLQESTFEQVGSSMTIKVDVRLISATNRELMEEVRQGIFRLDLYYRLCVVPIDMPPLRKRSSDIPLLAEYFIARFIRERDGKMETPQLENEVLSLLREYDWPGNIRELQNVVQFALMKSKGSHLRMEHVPSYLKEYRQKQAVEQLSVRKIRKLDRQSVLDALQKTEGNKVEASRELGVARATLYRFIKEEML